MRSSDCGQTIITQTNKRLRSIWLHADRLGLAAGPPERVSVVKAKGPQQRSPLLDHPPAGTPAAFYVEQVRPATLARGEDPEHFDTAVRRFVMFAGKDRATATVEPATIGEFAAWLLASGRSATTIAHYERYVRRLLAAADPQRFAVEDPAVKPAPRRPVELPPPAEEGTVRHFLKSVYAPQRLLDCKHPEKTYREHRRTLMLLREYLGRDARLDELSDELAAGWYAWLLERGACRTTVNHHRARLNAVARHARRKGCAGWSPDIPKLKENRDPPDAWTEGEAARLIDAAGELERPAAICGVPTGPYMRALLMLCFYTAQRRGSLLAIRRADVDLNGGWLNVRGDAVKTGKGRRFKLPADALAALRAIWQPERDQVFPVSDLGALSKLFRRALENAGIPHTRRRMNLYHKMRRTAATIAAQRGGLAAAMALLDHGGPEVTRRYLDPTKISTDAAALLPTLSLSAGGPARPDESYLAKAERLQAAGESTLAGYAARVAVERRLRGLCRDHAASVSLPKKCGLGQRLAALARASLLPADTHRRLRAAMKTANALAHGAAVEPHRLAELLDAAREFCGAGDNQPDRKTA